MSIILKFIYDYQKEWLQKFSSFLSNIGLVFSYVAPLVFVLTLTMLKEAYDDYKRYTSDKEANSFIYEVVTEQGLK